MKGLSPVHAIVVTGTIGAGKTAVAEELSLILHEGGVRHALVDVDGLGQCYPGPPDDPFDVALSFENLAAVWPNFRARGIRYAIIAHLIERADELDELRAALPGADLRTVLVVASPDTCAERLRRREISESVLERHLRRSPLLGRALEGLHVEDFRVSNEDRPIREVATDVVERLGWTPPARSVD